MSPPGPNAITARSRLRLLFLGCLMVLVFVEIVALSPSSLEQSKTSPIITTESWDTEDQGEITLATGIPKEKIPEYSVDDFNYVSTQSGQKQWKLLATKAFLYNQEKLVHARLITAHIYNPNGEITVVTGKEAKYFMNQRDLEIFGDVETQFPDGFITHSEYLRYRPAEGKIEVPIQYLVNGTGSTSKKDNNGPRLKFQSQGIDFSMKESEIILPSSVLFTFYRPQTNEETIIEADRCVIHRSKQIAKFSMSPIRPLQSRFVHINQPTLFVRSRRADLHYGDLLEILQYLVAFEDVLFKEKSQKTKTSLRYGTGGIAEFDSKREVIVLKEFPQVYQDNDTVTGEVIIIHRDTDQVEVEHSNAFSEGRFTD
jgi:LPS export ABC transporter protein LptC